MTKPMTWEQKRVRQDQMNDALGYSLRAMQQAEHAYLEAKRLHAVEREKPYDKWPRWERSRDEIEAREAYRVAKLEYEYTRAAYQLTGRSSVSAVVNGVVKTRKSVTINGVKIPVVRRVTPQ